jgi:hypothetical protein
LQDWGCGWIVGLCSITELTAAARHKTEIGKIENRNSFQLSLRAGGQISVFSFQHFSVSFPLSAFHIFAF